jgi:lytic murein transglycosylase
MPVPVKVWRWRELPVRKLIGLAMHILAWTAAVDASPAADAAFQQWLQSLWPAAQARGVTRATFDAATRDLAPDLSLPDLVIPGRAEGPGRGQAEFVQTPAEYLKETTIERLAAQARKLASEHQATLSAIERRFGVPSSILLAIWGRETAFGRHRLPYDTIQVLATQAYLGRRKEQFRDEFLLALKMLQEGHVARSGMRSSWAGAMGHTQFLPSDFYRYAVDFDGDGRRDIWNSIPDALASTAKQLVDKGWRPGQRWAYEVRVPGGLDCTIADPDRKMPIRDWLKRGLAPSYGRKLGPDELAQEALLLLPAGLYGPAFLAAENYFVIKEYNFSDLYVLFVGHLSDRIADPRPFETAWGRIGQMPASELEDLQRRLTQLGFYRDKIDGKAGMKTRLALGAYQKANGLKLDCWPNADALQRMRAGPASP